MRCLQGLVKKYKIGMFAFNPTVVWVSKVIIILPIFRIISNLQLLIWIQPRWILPKMDRRRGSDRVRLAQDRQRASEGTSKCWRANPPPKKSWEYLIIASKQCDERDGLMQNDSAHFWGIPHQLCKCHIQMTVEFLHEKYLKTLSASVHPKEGAK